MYVACKQLKRTLSSDLAIFSCEFNVHSYKLTIIANLIKLPLQFPARYCPRMSNIVISTAMPTMVTPQRYHATSLYLLLWSASSEPSLIEIESLSKIIISSMYDSASAELSRIPMQIACNEIEDLVIHTGICLLRDIATIVLCAFTKKPINRSVI